MPFVFPHHFVPPPPAADFGSSSQSVSLATVDDFAGSQKRPSVKISPAKSKSNKKPRAPPKEADIVDLDDEKEDVDLKNVLHWKDHWIIQLITIRGEMHSKFNATPKQDAARFRVEVNS